MSLAIPSLLGKKRRAETKEAVEPPKPRPKPRTILLGAGGKSHALLELYRANGHPDLAVVDRRPELVGGRLLSHEIHAFDDLDLDRLESVIVAEELHYHHYHDPVAYVVSKGVAAEKISTVVQPGKTHRALVNLLNLTDPEHLRHIGYRAIRLNLYQRENYAYCMILAAECALRMSLKEVTALEFGVWAGDGLKNMCEIADFIHQTLGIRFRIFGFDTAAGLPENADWRDQPELWDAGGMVMPDPELLRAQLPENCQLIIGNCGDTIPAFLAKHATPEAPIGFVSIDVDQYHSTVSALKAFDTEATNLLPVIPVWVDDSNISVFGTIYAGEALAIREYNDRNELRKFDQKIVRVGDAPTLWHHCIYFAHIFDHPIRQGKAGEMRGRFDYFFHINY